MIMVPVLRQKYLPPTKQTRQKNTKSSSGFNLCQITKSHKLPRVRLALTGTLVTETPIKAQAE